MVWSRYGIPKDKRTKLDDKVHRCVIVGFCDEMFDYKLYGPTKKEVTKIEMWYSLMISL